MNQVIESFKKPINLALATVWLFTVSAMVGVSLGYTEWFMAKTPLNLLISCGVLLAFYGLNKKTALYVVFVYIASLLIEMHGVHYGILFGPYRYLHHLGPKVAGVPWLIGINWTILVLSTASLASALLKNKLLRVLAGATAMTLLDGIIEPLASRFGFWLFDAGQPDWVNYAGWMGASLMFHAIYQYANLNGNVRVSWHIFVSQVVFFLFFNIAYGI